MSKFEYVGPGFYVDARGRKILIGDEDFETYPLIGMYMDTRSTSYWTKGGLHCSGYSRNDLVGPWVEPEPPLEFYVNVYDSIHAYRIHKTKNEAELAAGRNCKRVAVLIREVIDETE